MFFTQLGVMALSAMMAFSSPQSDAEPYTEEPQPAIVTEAYEYPVTPKDPEWAELGSTQARIKACRIPQEVLESMTEEQLVQAVLDFPFKAELFVYSYIETGVKSMEKNCDAYAELLRRGTAKDALLVKAAQLQKRPVTTAKEEIENEMIASLILYQEQVEQELTPLEVSQVRGLAMMAGGRDYDIYKSQHETSESPETPNGTSVDFYRDIRCSHSSSNYHAEMDDLTAETFM